MMTTDEYAKLLALHRWLCAKPRPKRPLETLIPDTPAYRKWLKNRVEDPRITDLRYGVVYIGSF